MVVVGVHEVVEDATFIHVNIATRSTLSAEEDNKIKIYDMSLNLFIKSE
jgi:hypothetical protein